MICISIIGYDQDVSSRRAGRLTLRIRGEGGSGVAGAQASPPAFSRSQGSRLLAPGSQGVVSDGGSQELKHTGILGYWAATPCEGGVGGDAL